MGIEGNYQYRALTEGPLVQRFWHYSKQLAIAQHLPPAPGDSVFDVGSGSGVISSYLGESGCDVTGIDGNNQSIRWAQEKFGRENVRFQTGLVDEQFKVDRLFDKIYCLEVIEHIYRHQAVDMLLSFKRVLKPGGEVFLTTPNYRSLWPVIEWMMDRFSHAPRMAGDQHVEKYDRQNLSDLCRETGFKVELMTTTCFLAPWLAPLSWALAEKVQRAENRRALPLGSILVSVLTCEEHR